MSTISRENALFSSVVRARHSVRKYDPNCKISREEIMDMLKEATLAPSTNNLQSWRFLVIDQQELKEKLLPVTYNQEQVVQASAIVVVLGDTHAVNKADQIYNMAIQAGYMTEKAKELMLANLRKSYENPFSDNVKRYQLINGSLVSMQLMLVAKARGYDTVPMIGYDEQALREALEIPDRYVVVMMIPIGKAAHPAHTTVRLPVEEITLWNKLPE